MPSSLPHLGWKILWVEGNIENFLPASGFPLPLFSAGADIRAQKSASGASIPPVVTLNLILVETKPKYMGKNRSFCLPVPFSGARTCFYVLIYYEFDLLKYITSLFRLQGQSF